MQLQDKNVPSSLVTNGPLPRRAGAAVSDPGLPPGSLPSPRGALQDGWVKRGGHAELAPRLALRVDVSPACV